MKFDDEFGSLNTSNWDAFNFACPGGCHNNVGDSPSNVAVSGGGLGVTLSSTTKGGFACSTNVSGDCQSATPTGWALPVGGFVEARINFPGSGTTIYNWPAFWACQMQAGWCNNAAGEIDIAEGLGALTINYHSPTSNLGTGTVPGTWAGGYHTFAVYRSATQDKVYWDGTLVRTITTSDNGQPEDIILQEGEAGSRTQVTPSTMQVDYVRGWTGTPS